MPVTRHITSRHNSQFQRWRTLLESEGSKDHQQCLVAGAKLTREILNNRDTSIDETLFPPGYNIPKPPSTMGMPYILTKQLFRELDIFGTQAPLLVCPTPIIPAFNLREPPLGLEILCPIGDPGNLGALLRSCRAFNVQKVILLHESVHPFHPKVIRASSGTVFLQSLNLGPSVLDLHNPEILQWVIPLDMQGESLTGLNWPKDIRLLIGEEGMGIPPLPYPRRFSITQVNDRVPLNVTVASSIALYAYRQQHPAQSLNANNFRGHT